MTTDPRTPEQKKRGILAGILSAGVTFPVAVLVGFFAGRWVDRRFGLEPFGLLVGVMLGLGAALVPLFRASAAWDRADREAKNPTDPAPPTPPDAPPPGP